MWMMIWEVRKASLFADLYKEYDEEEGLGNAINCRNYEDG